MPHTIQKKQEISFRFNVFQTIEHREVGPGEIGLRVKKMKWKVFVKTEIIISIKNWKQTVFEWTHL